MFWLHLDVLFEVETLAGTAAGTLAEPEPGRGAAEAEAVG